MSISMPMKPEPAAKGVPLLRGETRATRSGRSIRLAALRVPLAVKLFGANLFVVGVLAAGWLIAGGTLHASVIALLALVIVVHLALMFVALRPIRDLEAVA